MSAAGRRQSGSAQKFEELYADDKVKTEALTQKLNDINPQRFEGMAVETLVRRRIRIAALANEARNMRDNYVESVDKDDKERDHLRSDMRERKRPK